MEAVERFVHLTFMYNGQVLKESIVRAPVFQNDDGTLFIEEPETKSHCPVTTNQSEQYYCTLTMFVTQ